MVAAPAVFTLSHGEDETTARRITVELQGELFAGPANLGEDLETAFRARRPIIAVFSSGIVIRHLAGLIGNKPEDPPVLSVSRDGSAVVPLLGGHNGANRLARQIAKVTGGAAAITTASDVAFGLSLDDPEPGYELANPENFKAFTASLLKQQAVKIDGKADWLGPLPVSDTARLQLSITETCTPGNDGHLVYHPKTLMVGMGCERGASVQAVSSLIHETLAAHNLTAHSIAAIGTISIKADESALNDVAENLGAGPLRLFSADELNAEEHRLQNPSERVRQEVGCPSVAEAAALRLAGPEGELIVAKTKNAKATCAIARARAPVQELPGNIRGCLFVTGLGPGDPAFRTPAATTALTTSTDWVGYGLYLDLAKDVNSGQHEHRFPLGGEEDRVRHAIMLASQGRRVCLVCSGDAGIYAMAALVYEVMDDPALSDPERRISIEVVPGISAFQTAAARAGALIGHDFCCISLSDLLTPWPIIEKRIQAAAEGDFVTAFYNPRSRKRTDQLSQALKILEQHRPSQTPVVIASNLGRPEEHVRMEPLGTFNPEDVDMLTIVLVGSSQSILSRTAGGRPFAYTPRGYAAKRNQKT